MESIKVNGKHIGNVTEWRDGYKAYSIHMNMRAIFPTKTRAIEFLKSTNESAEGQ